MDLVYLVIGLALIEYFGFGMLAGQARGKHGVEAPAVIGHPDFERRFRVQQNTLEQLVIFIPSILIFSQYWSPLIAAAMGIVFVLGRLVYYRGYVADPSKRGTGFLIGMLAQTVLLLGALIGAGSRLIA
ncbi:MAG: MAPEG family protein [Myxococcota bacterium]|nr:MAPEG family protein [Myxococcota bacterium]